MTAPRLKEKYKTVVVPQLEKELGIQNINEVPRLEKIVVNMGVGAAASDHKLLEAAVAERAAFAVRLRHCGDTGGQVVLDRLLERGTQSVIAVLLFALGAPFAAVVDARNAGHAEQQRIDQRPGQNFSQLSPIQTSIPRFPLSLYRNNSINSQFLL